MSSPKKIIDADRKFFLTRLVVLPYTNQLAPETLIERSREKILPMMKATRDHRMKWRPADAVYGLDLRLSITGIFDGEFGRNTAVGTSRQTRQ